jgi:hypothetical protein
MGGYPHGRQLANGVGLAVRFLVVNYIWKSNPTLAENLKTQVFRSLYPSNGRLMLAVTEGGFFHHGSLMPPPK